jgi:glycyl-tRNA synthetase beta chain
MAVRDLLLEIGCEEIPARFMPEALRQLQEKTEKLLAEHYLDLEDVFVFATPRRLVVLVKNLAEKQPDREAKIKGPSREAAFDSEGKPTKAALGFAAKIGVRVEELTLEKADRKEYLAAVQKISGEKTSELLLKLLPGLIKSLTFPKNMFWEESRVRFPRPIRWLLCLYGNEIVPFQYAGLTAGCETRGHRFHTSASGPITVRDPAHYFDSLEKAGVVLDQEQRAQLIREKIQAAVAGHGLQACIDPALLEEVVYLVEAPEAMLCSFPESYLQLPREVLVTTMQSHQRYFPLENLEGRLCPLFITVSNNCAAPLDNVRSGNEKVLRARLADARFFYREDLKTPLEDKVEKLKTIVFQEELGTVYEKTLRLVRLSEFLADQLGVDEGEKETALRAAYLCKADLATNMVGEFPELQGVMGKEYALQSAEKEETAEAVFEHYLPRFAGDRLPRTKPGAIVALADRADHLAGCFAVGLRPTGSQDPYALRRSCLGLLQILLEHNFPLSFSRLMEKALDLYRERKSLRDLPLAETTVELRTFAWQRLRILFQERGMDYDLTDAVLSSSLDDVVSLWKRVKFLQENRNSERLSMAAAAYNRVANLVRRAQTGVNVREELFREEGERKLFSRFQAAVAELEAALSEEDLEEALAVLAELKSPLDAFFDEVLVMAEEETLRLNRLSLLQEIKGAYLGFADFSKIIFPASQGNSGIK